MRKPDFCICKNKGEDQLCGNHKNVKPQANFCGCTGKKPQNKFSCNGAHFNNTHFMSSSNLIVAAEWKTTDTSLTRISSSDWSIPRPSWIISPDIA